MAPKAQRGNLTEGLTARQRVEARRAKGEEDAQREREASQTRRSSFLTTGKEAEAEEAAARAAELARIQAEKDADIDTLPDAATDSEEERLKERGPPPATGKLYMLPRDYRRIVEIEVEAEGKNAEIRNIGPDLGEGKGKYVGCARSRVGSNFYSVPYGTSRVLVIDPITSRSYEIGGNLEEGENKYTQAVSCVNWHGRMYAAPCKATRVLEIDPDKATAKEVGPPLGEKGVSKWFAIASSPFERGRIYAIPYDARRVLEINPSMGGKAKEIGPDLGSMKGKYRSVAVAPTGDLYCAPLNAPKVLRIQPSTGEVTVCGPDFGKTERKFACLIPAPNKLLYAPPLYADRVIEIRTTSGEVREIGPIIGSGEAKYACGAVAYNGKIYCAPLEARKVLEINCEDHEVQYIGRDIGGEGEKYSSIAASPAGRKLFAAPREARNVLEIDPELYMIKEIGKDMGSIARKFTCIVPGLTHKELVGAQKLTLYFAAKAVEVAERNQSFALREMTFATETHMMADQKVKNYTPVVDEAQEEVDEAQQIMQEAEKTKTQGAVQASYWIDCREKFMDATVKLNRALDKKSSAVSELKERERELKIKTERLQEMNSKVEKAQKEKALAEENNKKSIELEKEHRRQAGEAEDAREKSRKY